MSKTKTRNVEELRDVLLKMGDNLNDTFEKTNDLKVAHQSLHAYRTAIAAVKTQLIYKKLTGTPSEIDFLK